MPIRLVVMRGPSPRAWVARDGPACSHEARHGSPQREASSKFPVPKAPCPSCNVSGICSKCEAWTGRRIATYVYNPVGDSRCSDPSALGTWGDMKLSEAVRRGDPRACGTSPMKRAPGQRNADGGTQARSAFPRGDLAQLLGGHADVAMRLFEARTSLSGSAASIPCSAGPRWSRSPTGGTPLHHSSASIRITRFRRSSDW
jgi:hypothetical protein